MPCQTVKLPGGGAAIVCTATSRCACGKRAPFLCDWKVPARKTGTCDKPICGACVTSPAPGKDLCPTHAKAWEAWKAAHP